MLISATTSLPQRKRNIKQNKAKKERTCSKQELNTLPVKVRDQSFIIPLQQIIEVSLMKTIKANEVTYVKRLETDKQDRDRVSLLRIIKMDLNRVLGL